MPTKSDHNRLDDLFADLEADLPPIEGDTKPNQITPQPPANPHTQPNPIKPKLPKPTPKPIISEIPSERLSKDFAREIVGMLPKTTDIIPRLRVFTVQIGKTSGAHSVTTLLFNADKSTQRVVAEYTSFGVVIPGIGMEIPFNAISEILVKNRTTIQVQNGTTGPETQALFKLMQTQGIQNRTIFPIFQNGDVIGSLTLDQSDMGQNLSSSDIQVIEYLLDQVINMLEP